MVVGLALRSRKVLCASLAESAMPITQPNIKALVIHRVLDDNVGCAIMVHVRRRDRKRRFRRIETEARISTARQVKLDDKSIVAFARIDEDGSIQLVIVIEVGDREGLSGYVRKLQRRRYVSVPERTGNAILRPQGRPCERQDGDEESDTER